jgi:flagellar biosynthesis/type III secretory pathway M-ring protein FliF/YscJ
VGTLGAIVGGVVMAVAIMVWLLLRGRSRRRELAEVALTLGAAETAAAGEALAPAMPARPAMPPRPAGPIVPEELMAISRERDDIRQKVVGMATSEPDASAQLIRAWLVKKKEKGHHAG